MKERINLTTLDHKNIDFGKEYNFAGYKWIPIKIDKERNIAVIQSLGVTAGPWPGYILPQFGNGNEYYKNIAGKNISNYDKKMQDLYEFIKKVEAEAEDGAGLYLLNQSVESLQTAMKALAKAADNKIDGSLYECVWLGDAFDGFALYVGANKEILYGTGQNDLFIVAPTFNLDLSKVEIRDDEIVIISNIDANFGISLFEKPDVYGLTKSEIDSLYDMLDENEVYPLEISGSQSSAMGFITQKAAEVINYDYENSGLKEFISSILNDMDKESEDGIYNFQGIRIYLGR